jgi:hypothetical protein
MLPLIGMEMISTFLPPFLYYDLDKPKLAKTSHPTSEVFFCLTFNQEKYSLRAIADTGASSSMILEAYTSKPLINNNDRSNGWSVHYG